MHHESVRGAGAGGRRSKRWIVASAVAVTAALLVSSCASGGTQSSGEQKLTVAITADPRSLEPNSSTAQAEMTVSEQIVEKLIEFSADSKDYEARLATEWEQKDDTTVELKLREGVKFTNGEDFNAESAVYSINNVLLKSEAYSSFVSMISEAVVVDDYTIDVKSSEPTGLMLNALAMGSFMYPQAYFEQEGAEAFGEAPIGTGPFVFESWTKGDNVTLSANPDYWGGAPKLETVVFQVIPDKSAQIAAAQTGTVDMFLDVPVGSIDQVKSDSSLSIVTKPSNRVFYLFMSELTDTPLKNKEVRQALWYAIDSQSLIDQQLGGYGYPLKSQILVDGYTGYDDSFPEMTYDPEKAKQMLADAGYPDGFEITFKYSSGRYAQDAELGQAIAAQLAEVGITATQEPLESGTFLTQLLSLDLNDLSMMGSLPPSDAHFMYQQFKTGGTYSYYSNTTIDSLIDQEVTESDPEARNAIFKQMTEEFIDDPAFVPLFQGEDTYLVNANVEGFEPRASQFIDIRQLSIK